MTESGETRCRYVPEHKVFTLRTFSGSVQLLDPSDDIDSGNEYEFDFPKVPQCLRYNLKFLPRFV